MKVKFMSDYKDHKEGDVVDVSPDEADDLHQAGRACPYVKPEPVAEAPKAESKKAKK